ncbi:pentapeptide repeat-containing protein [Mycobacterium sp. DL440]|uniref:pentapeptide repeat-containing protein n=1 Tax=Mycobacterium sp. DL440 TaxID=2675523 RepID=UPI001AAEEAFF|nr:pentapeptide repeat-containing protein [Mycobacterium sp. DL440]
MDVWLTQPLATLLAGSVVAVAAVVTFASSALGRRQVQRHFASQHDLDRERSLQDRYTEAATQLGAESSAIRLAGALSLVALADDWLGRGSTVSGQMTIDLLRAYLRVAPAGQYGPGEHEIRKTILLQTSQRASWWSQLADDAISQRHEELRLLHRKTLAGRAAGHLHSLRRARRNVTIRRRKARSDALLQELFPRLGLWKQADTRLDGASLAACNLGRIHIAGAHLADATMAATNLEFADLERVLLSRANLVEARLVNVYARKAVLDHADLTHENLRRANLTEVDLTDANLAGADLEGSILSGAVLQGTNLTGASLGDHDPAELATRGAILDDPSWSCRCTRS